PAVELGLGKQPAAGHLGARHRALGHHFVDLALLEPEVGGRLGGGEQLHGLHTYAPFSGAREKYISPGGFSKTGRTNVSPGTSVSRRALWFPLPKAKVFRCPERRVP